METCNGKLEKLIAVHPPAGCGPMGVSPPVEDPRFEEIQAELKELQVNTKAMQATLDSVSRPATSGYTTPSPSGVWGVGPPSGSPLGSPSFSPPTFGSPNPYSTPSMSPSAGFDRVPDPTVVKDICHTSLVLRDDVKDFVQKQIRDAGLDNFTISVEGQVSANTFIVKFERELQRCCKQVQQLLDAQKVDKGIWKNHSIAGADEQPHPVYINPDKNGRRIKTEIVLSKWPANSEKFSRNLKLRSPSSILPVLSSFTGSTRSKLLSSPRPHVPWNGTTRSLRNTTLIGKPSKGLQGRHPFRIE